MLPRPSGNRRALRATCRPASWDSTKIVDVGDLCRGAFGLLNADLPVVDLKNGALASASVTRMLCGPMPVNHPFAVGVANGVGNLSKQVQAAGRRQLRGLSWPGNDRTALRWDRCNETSSAGPSS